jgi:hypothetical protein
MQRSPKTANVLLPGNIPTTLTNLSTVAKAVLASLTTAEVETRNTLLNISSFTGTQLQVVAALEKVTGEKWEISNITSKEQLQLAGATLEKGDFLNALYLWIKSAIWSDAGVLEGTENWNKVLGLKEEVLEDVVRKVVNGEEV